MINKKRALEMLSRSKPELQGGLVFRRIAGLLIGLLGVYFIVQPLIQG